MAVCGRETCIHRKNSLKSRCKSLLRRLAGGCCGNDLQAASVGGYTEVAQLLEAAGAQQLAAANDR